MHPMKTVLVLGGAGYIGSVMTKTLCDAGYKTVVYDNLSRGKKELVDKRAEFVEGDVLDKEKLDTVFRDNDIDTVMHFASRKSAGESMEHPELYTQDIVGTVNVLEMINEYKVKKIIFSSSAAVYGNPVEDVITEEHPTEPTNFYGFTKLEIERILKWYAKLKNFSVISLRYFNVAGDGGLKYVDPNAENIFSVISEVMEGKRDSLTIFGNDYDTRDGTCIRDYIHILDLVDAHMKALELDKEYEVLNLGTKTGCTVLELVKEFEKVSGKDIPVEISGRRDGDPEKSVASSDKAKEVLGWEPKLGLEDMVQSTVLNLQEK